MDSSLRRRSGVRTSFCDLMSDYFLYSQIYIWDMLESLLDSGY